jgi:hypothetical protein
MVLLGKGRDLQDFFRLGLWQTKQFAILSFSATNRGIRDVKVSKRPALLASYKKHSYFLGGLLPLPLPD